MWTITPSFPIYHPSFPIYRTLPPPELPMMGTLKWGTISRMCLYLLSNRPTTSFIYYIYLYAKNNQYLKDPNDSDVRTIMRTKPTEPVIHPPHPLVSPIIPPHHFPTYHSIQYIAPSFPIYHPLISHISPHHFPIYHPIISNISPHHFPYIHPLFPKISLTIPPPSP